MTPKRILIFSLAYYPKHVGGAEVAIKEITDRLGDAYSFDMVTLRFDSTLPRTEKVGNVNVHRIGFSKKDPRIADLRKFPLHLNKLYFQFVAVFKAAALHRRNRYDAVWAMMAYSTGVPAVLFKLFHPGVRYILSLQEGDMIRRMKRNMLPLYPLFVRAFRSADAVQAISAYLARWARDMGYRGVLEVIPNGVDTAHFSRQYPAEELSMLQRKLGKKGNDVFLITTSRLVPKNGIRDIISALTFLPKEYRLLILGEGPLEESLKLQVAGYKLQDRVLFLGQIDHMEMPKYLNISDIFVRPSLSEGMGNSFVEAMAAGLPVVATQEGGIADFLFDPERNLNKPSTGLAVNPRDPEGIARQCRRLAEDEKLRTEIIRNARELVFANYDWDKIARDMKEKVFDKLS